MSRSECVYVWYASGCATDYTGIANVLHMRCVYAYAFENMLLFHPRPAMCSLERYPAHLCFLHNPWTRCGRFPAKLQGLGSVGQDPRPSESVASSLDKARNLSIVQCPWVAWRNKDTRSLWSGLVPQSCSPNTKTKLMCCYCQYILPAANAVLLSQNPAPRPQAPQHAKL